jgi:hypothetical protein
MKIVSRPKQDDDELLMGMGTGNHVMLLTDAQLELIAALCYQCRLGQNTPYSVAAMEIGDMIESVHGSDFSDNAANNVDLQVTIEDDHGGVVFNTKSGNFYPTLEV